MTSTTTKATHTPGPWEYLDGSILCESVNAYGNFHIAQVDRGDEKMTDEDYANARLIAAAPDLYAALLAVSHRWDADDERDAPELGEMIRSALRRAEGKGEEVAT